MHTEHDYSAFWERCWNKEDADALARWLDAWNRSSDPEMGLFRQHGVKTVCDAACGFGAHTLAFASNGFDVSAFDISPRAVELTSAGLQRYGWQNVDVRLAGITDTGYPDGAFDAAAAYAVLDHLTEADAKRALAELFRIVKPDGLLLLSFDAAEEDDYRCPHELLPDGSMLYTEDASRAGMIFRPCDEEKITAFVGGYQVVRRWTNRKGDRVVVLQKRE